jgi:hypothetical protein
MFDKFGKSFLRVSLSCPSAFAIGGPVSPHPKKSVFAEGEACSGGDLIVVFQITNYWLGRTLAHRTDKLLVKGATPLKL